MVPANKQSQFSINMWPSQQDRKPQECVIVTCCLNPSFGHTISLDFFSDSSASAHGLLPLQTELHLETPKLVKNHQKQHTEEAYQDMHDCGEKKKSNALSIAKCSFFIRYAVTTAPLHNHTTRRKTPTVVVFSSRI
jgi:hypothetical protein